MQWLNELPFADNRVLQIGFLAACGIAALVVLAIVYRLAFAHRLRVPGGRTRQPRLGLVDAFSLDGQRQLVLIRRDNIEHLVMIGGPNDVLVKSQINRAAVPARETNQASPLLVPSTPVRRTEAAALPASPAVVEPREGRRQGPGFAARASSGRPQLRRPPRRWPRPRRSRRPLLRFRPPRKRPRSRSPPSPASIPAQASAPEPARPAVSVAPAVTQAAEPARPAPASSPPRQAEPRPAQPRATMPPPIIPANASPNRGAPVRATETSARERAGQSPGLVSRRAGAVAPPGETGSGGRRLESGYDRHDGENGAACGADGVPPASAGPAQARPTPRTPSSAPAFDGAQRTVDARPPGDKANAAGKPPPKVDDPFADLDSLEAEMARLLGREKSD